MFVEITASVDRGEGFSKVRAACDAAGGKWWISIMNGQAKGESATPQVTATYPTMNHGPLKTFPRITSKPGDIVEHDGRQWEVVAVKYVAGDAHMPSTQWFVAKEIAS